MIPRELLRRVRRIEIRTSHIVNDVLAGQYHSAFKGRGMEFEEVRQYQIGDDVRTIDWNVSARYGEPFVKVFREERELTVLLLVDLSASHAFGSSVQLKRDLVAEICATLAFSAIRNNDKVGLMCFTDTVEKVVPARKGVTHVLRVIREVLYHQPRARRTSIQAAVEHLNRAVKRKAVVFLISDFLDPGQGSRTPGEGHAGDPLAGKLGYEDALRIARRRHDIVPIIVRDPREFEMPDVGLVELEDAETGELVLVDTSSRRFRRAYAERARQLAAGCDQGLRRMNIDAIHVQTGESFVQPLQRFFREREARL